MALKTNNKHKINDIPQFSPPLNRGQPPSTHLELPWVPNKPHVQSGSTCLPERPKTLSTQTPPEGAKTPCVQLSKASIYTQENIKDLPVGGRLKWFVKQWEQHGAHPFHLDILKQGYRLPFRDHPKLSRTPCIHSGYNEIDKDSALSSSILDLLAKNAIEEVNKQDSLGFYSRLFLVPKPGNRWRPVIDLSSLNQYLTVSKFKMETPESIRTSLRQGEWVTSIDLSDAYLHIPIHPQSRKFLRFHHKETSYQFTSLPFGLATAPLVFTSLVKEVKSPSSKAGHSSKSVLRRLADKGLFPGRSSETHRQASLPDTKPRVYSKPPKVRTQPPAEVRLHRLPFFVGPRSCQTHKRQMEQDPNFIQQNFQEICHQCTNSHVHHWITGVHRENSKIGQDTHETFPMAPQDPLERLGRTLKSRLRRRHMVSSRKTTTHKCIGTKSSDPSSSTFLTTMQQETGVSSIRQHHSSSPHKQTGGNPLNRTLCPHVETSHMVQQKPDNPQGKTRPRLSQCNCRRPFQEKPNTTHRVVSGTPDFQEDLSTLGTSSDRSICHKPEYKTPNLCVPDPGPTGLGSGRSKHILEKHDRLRLSPHSTTTKSGPKVTVPGMQAHPDSSGLANKVVVLGSGGTISRPPKTTPTNSLTTQTTTEQPIPHSPRVPQPPRMVSRSSILQDQGFSAEVADRIAAPQRLSTRAIYASKWAVFERWCIEQQVDFRAPSIQHICDFMCFLFNEKDRRPSTIEGYRTAIADTLGNAPLDISNNAEIARLIASFHRDKPKSTRKLPQWDLSLVLHQLKQPPFEPLEEAQIKYVTWENSLFTSPSLREKTE